MERILGRDTHGSTKRFFLMLWKARLPYLWILGYIAASVLLTRLGISSTKYTAELYAGNVGFLTVVIPFILVTVLSVILNGLNGMLRDFCSTRINRNMRLAVWRKIVRLPVSYYESNQPGEMVSRITTDVAAVSTLVIQVFIAFVTTGYTSLAILGEIGGYDKRLMLNVLLALPLEALVAFVMGKLHFGVSDVANKKNAELTQTVRERANNYLLVKSANTQDREYAAGERKMREVYRYGILSSWMGFSGPMYAVACMVQFLLIVLVGRPFYSDGTLELAQWIAYYGFATQLFNALSQYCNYWTTYKNSQGATKRVADIMCAAEEDVDLGDRAEGLSGDVDLKDVSFTYGNGRQVFDHLNLHIPAGHVVGIIGPSGSGKTTLMNLIERMYPAQEGTISFGEDDIFRFSLRSFRESITYMTQECTLFSGTIRQNLLFGVRREVEDAELLEACREAELTEFLDSCPDGLDTQVGEAGALLSGGQRQRIALARALLLKNNYLFMDEATTAMDVRAKQAIWTAIRGRMAGGTVLMIAHDRQTVREADYLVVLEDGKVTCQGTREKVAASSAYYQELMGKGDEEQ